MEHGGRSVLGVSADFHDAAAALVVAGEVVAAAEEERFARVKHDPSMPRAAISWCLDHGGIGPGDLGRVVFYEKPLSAFDRILSSHATNGPSGFPALADAVSTWSRTKLWAGYRLERLLRDLGQADVRVEFAEHHQSHAASAFYPSPFDRAAIMVLDGVGEWASSSIGWGAGHRIEMRAQSRFPNSIGLFYSAFTTFCGFEVNDGEYKLMGLAPYGEPRYADVLREHVIHVHDDGSIRLDQKWFAYLAGRRMTRRRLGDLLDGPARHPDDALDQRFADIARSVQDIVNEAIVKTGRHAREVTGERSVCTAGGVALNCVANEQLLEDGSFDDVWVQPAAGDSGGALGAALWNWHQIQDRPRAPRHRHDAMSGALLGPAFSQHDVRTWLERQGTAFEEFDSHEELCASVAERIDRGALVGWFQGRMEFGPRALGHRSILGDPRRPDNVERINTLVKQRESFRPFAPAVMAEHAQHWFDVHADLPYMTVTAQVHEHQRVETHPATGSPQGFGERLAEVRSTIPACTHVDMSARVQTVDADVNPLFHRLLSAFFDRTHCPVLINTSFNRAGSPIVRTPSDALDCFRTTGLDVLVLERCVIERHLPAGAV